MHKQWNIISQDFPGLERNSGIKIPVKMTRDPGNPGFQDRTPNNQDGYRQTTQRGTTANDLIFLWEH